VSAQAFDSVQFKQGQLQQWDTVAPAWQQWWATWQRATQNISERLVELAELKSGQRVLDIATGLGEPAFTAARHIGPNGRVIATDFSGGMLEEARVRAEAEGIANVEFHEIDAEVLALPGGIFDAALCRWGLTEFPDVVTALRRIYQQLAPGGRLAAAVWAAPPAVPLIGIPVGILRQRFNVPPPVPGTPSPFGLADTTKLTQVLEQAGFEEVRLENQIATFKFSGFEEYRHFLEDIAPVVRAVLGNQSSEQQTEAWQAISGAIQKFANADGGLQIPNDAICIVGKR
jgi:enediyne biosynthesis protein CalE5